MALKFLQIELKESLEMEKAKADRIDLKKDFELRHFKSITDWEKQVEGAKKK